ncbi:cap-specific mRNA (nucleoside-2'-O-)-methyltransferase 1 isoform X3 [Folsomia candida]|nr:cap-specific mRNA (nucleoside-2'-O-)-methyltransferase 1 isoform X3 [Folsomia candida]
MDTDSEADKDKMDLPPPAHSVSSFASSSGASNSSMRRNRLPPPPPSVDWSSGSKSILGKRGGSLIGGDSKKMDFDDTASISSVDESIPVQELAKLDQDRRGVKYIPFDRQLEPLTYDGLVLGRTIGVQEPATYVDTTFCARNVLEHLMEVKYQIRNVSGERYKALQDRMMDFGSGPVFHHSEAYLLANIDALTNWSITKPINKHGELLVGQNGPEILYVGDIHGGPGGFAEYVLSRMGWGAKVFGYTFTDEAYEYQLTASGHFSRESFERWMGRDGRRGDGSIYRPEFVDMFARHCKRITGWQGLHVVLAGGRELTPGLDEDRKELRAKAMLLAETTIALKSLREGGTFVLRLYDLFTPFTVGLVYLIYRAFDQVTILRPEAGRPGSSERFLVATQFKGGKACQEIELYLCSCHSTDHACHVNHKYPEDQQADIVELVPVDTIKSAARFYDYIYDSNANIGFKQLEETGRLCKALQYRDDGNVVRDRLFDIRRKCSTMWNCPRAYRQEPKHIGLAPEVFANKLLRPYPENVLRRVEREGEVLLTYPVMEKDLKNPKEWSFVCVGRDRGFYMSMGGDKVFRFSSGEWKAVTVDNVEMADHTLVYGDIVDEITHLEGKQIIVTAFHIIDGLILGNKDIRNLPYNERMEMCGRFAKSMDKTAREDYIHIRGKKTLDATRLEAALASVHKEQVKGRGDRKKRPLAPVDLSESKTAVHAHTGYVFLKTIKEGGSPADFLTTMQNRLYWQLDDTQDRNPQGPLLPRPKDPVKMKNTVVCAPALVHHISNMANAN